MVPQTIVRSLFQFPAGLILLLAIVASVDVSGVRGDRSTETSPQAQAKLAIKEADNIIVNFGESVLDLAISSNGDLIAPALWDERHIRIWTNKQQTLLPAIRFDRRVRSVIFIPDTDVLVAGIENGTIVAVDVDSGKVKFETSASKTNDDICSICVSPTGKIIVASVWSDPAVIVAIDAENGKIMWSQNYECLPQSSPFVKFSRDGKYLYSTGVGVRAWDAKSGNLIFRESGDRTFGQMSFSQDGKFMAIVAGPKRSEATAIEKGEAQLTTRIQIRQTGNGKLVKELPKYPGALTSILPSGDFKYVIAGTKGNGALQVWNVRTGQSAVVSGIHGGPEGIDLRGTSAVERLGTGQVFCSTGGDGAVRKWEMKAFVVLLSKEGD